MYLLQAQNIVEGQPQDATGYLYNEDYPELGPPAYPIGFPLLLAPILAFFGNSIAVLTFYMALFLLAWVMLSFSYWKKQHLAFPEIVILSLLMGYSPWILNFKDEILSDIPFAAFLMLLARLQGSSTSSSWFRLAGLGILAGLIVSIRSAGWPAVAALFLFQLIPQLRHKFSSPKLLSSLLIPVLAFLSQWLLGEVVFQVPQAPEGSYMGIWESSEAPLHLLMLDNLQHYLRILEDFFHPANDIWGFTSILLRQFALVAITLGAVIHLSQKWRFTEYLVLLYLGLILVYPYQAGGFRLLLPLLPFLLEYAVTGLRSIRIPSRVPYSWRVGLIGLFLAFTYRYDLATIIQHSDSQQDGPQKSYAQEIFRYLQTESSQVKTVLFSKPRVMAYYAGVPGMAPSPDLPLAKFNDLIRKERVSHLLFFRNQVPSKLEQYAEQYPEDLTVLLANDKLKLCRIDKRQQLKSAN